MSLRWVDRKFTFTTPLELWPVIVERLRGTPARVEEKVRALPRERLVRREGTTWSIQEHVGHLLDLDDLHAKRLDDFLARVPVLRAADPENRKTTEARHNERPIEEILAAFRADRGRFVATLENWDERAWGLTAVHPRLQQPMRVIDSCFFVAEHDDHHLARMTELARALAAR